MKNEKPKRLRILPLGPEGISTIPGPILTDPFGSYTGLIQDEDDQPVQDADDL